MNHNNKIKYNLKVNKYNDITNQRRQNIKNIYTQIKSNIKTTYSQNKQKNRLNIMTKKRLTENLNKKNDSNNINLLFSKKPEESRNINKVKLEKNIDEEIFNAESDIFFNKTEKDIKLLYNKNNSKKSFKNISKPNLRLKSRDKDKEKEILNKQSYYYSTKETIETKDKKNINNNFLLNNKKINNNKEMNPLNITNKNKFKENNENNKKQNSFEKISKLMLNKKLISKEDFIKSKNAFEKLNSARLINNEDNKFNLNLNKELNSDIKTISSKNTSRLSSQKLIDLKEKELNFDKIKKIKKNKIIKQIKLNGNKKNHSMTMNDSNKILFLNDTLKETIKKEKPKEKRSIVNLYNYPSVKNNIPHHKNHIIDCAEQENSENNIKNDFSILNCTCFNFNETNLNMNSTLNNNLNKTLNQNGNKKRTPNKCHYHNNSFSNLYNQVNFYSKPVARLKKRILDPPSDKKNDNSMNNKISDFILDKSDAKDNDSLEIDKNENDNNNMIKEFLITIKVLNQIINTQKKIIEEHIINEFKLKKEIEQKEKEMKNYKNICMKLMFFIKEEKEINILNEKNKKRQILENQLLKENEILKEIIKVPILNINKKNDEIENKTDELDLTCKQFYKCNINENGSTINFYKTNLQKNNENKKEIENNSLDPLCNIEIINNPILNKRREKSYENRKNKKSDNMS